MNIRFGVILLASLVLAACNSSTSSNLPNSNATSTTVSVLSNASSPVVNIPVTLSTSLNNGVPGGTIIATSNTDGNGQVTFNGLPSTGVLCVSASQSVSGAAQTAGVCHQPFPSSVTLKF